LCATSGGFVQWRINTTKIRIATLLQAPPFGQALQPPCTQNRLLPAGIYVPSLFCFQSLIFMPALTTNLSKGAAYLVKAQNDDNGWGGAGGVPSRITLTAKSISALAAFSIQYPETVERGFAFIHVAYRSGELEKKNR